MKYMYQILKGIPLDTRRKYPFPDMEIGDCFSFDTQDSDKVYSASRRFSSAQGCRNTRFQVRRQGDGVSRIWRIA